MAEIVPTITAFEPDEYRAQMEQIASFVTKVHIDLMDGDFAPTVSPNLDSLWWPHHIQADIHLMYRRPMEHVDRLIELNPRLVIIHEEAELDHVQFTAPLRSHGILVGLAILQETPVTQAEQIIQNFDHILVFSGSLGRHGGQADMKLLNKVEQIKQLNSEVEIGWDGGIDDKNAKQLVDAGVNVLNVGGFIQKSVDPKKAYDTLLAKVKG